MAILLTHTRGGIGRGRTERLHLERRAEAKWRDSKEEGREREAEEGEEETRLGCIAQAAEGLVGSEWRPSSR